MITLFILESVNDRYLPIVYAISLERQIEVERLAKTITIENIDNAADEFEKMLDKNNIKYEWIGRIFHIEDRQKDWIDDKIPRVIVG